MAVTQKRAMRAFQIVREWAMRTQGYTEEELNGTDLALRMDWDWPSGGPTPSIIWEGGPYDWAMDLSFDVSDAIAGIWAEPYSGWALCLYPD
jgi:hypothetical protein